MSPRAKEKQPLAVNFVVQIYRLAYNLTDIVLLPEAKSVGMALADATLAYDLDIDIIGVTRNGAAQFMPPPQMIYGPGNYKFADFLRVGTPLNILFWLLATFLIPKIWPL